MAVGNSAAGCMPLGGKFPASSSFCSFSRPGSCEAGWRCLCRKYRWRDCRIARCQSDSGRVDRKPAFATIADCAFRNFGDVCVGCDGVRYRIRKVAFEICPRRIYFDHRRLYGAARRCGSSAAGAPGRVRPFRHGARCFEQNRVCRRRPDRFSCGFGFAGWHS